MLTGAEPRGLPFTYIDRIRLQRAGEECSLTDVIVHARGFDEIILLFLKSKSREAFPLRQVI